MKRRVLRTHANKRCLRILSASHQLRTPSSTDKAHAVLCDASFLRAVLLTYWQAQAPAQWRKARARQLNKAAAPHAAASQEEQKEEEETPKEETEGDEPQQQQHKQEKKQQRSGLPATINAALLVARLPVPQMPALSPFDFLYALTHDAFHSSNSSDASPAAMSTVGSAGSDRFIFHCLPETVAALHRMREPAATTSAGAEDPAPQQQQQSSGSTPAWLAASLVSLEEAEKESALHRRTGAAAPLTFQELPAAVVDALLSRLHLLQDPSNDAVAQIHAAPPPSSSFAASPSASSSSQQQQLRNEAKAIAVFMDFNSRCLAHGGSADALGNTNGLLEKVRLCPMPRFSDVAVALGHHALKRQRQRLRGQSAAASARGGPVASRPFLPRSFFVATQSHDVRRLLPPTAALLRLTTKPDAIWIELRGQSYTYNDDHSSSSSSKHGGADVTTKRMRSPGSASSSTAHSPPHRGQRSGATVMSAAPSLSRADVAFMKHLGTATHVPLPEKNTASAAATAAAADAAVAAPQHPLSAGRGGGAAGGAARKRLRQRGQNPLSMKKKRKREVFRA